MDKASRHVTMPLAAWKMKDVRDSADYESGDRLLLNHFGHLFILRAASCRRFPALDRVHELLDLMQHRLLIAGEGQMIDAR